MRLVTNKYRFVRELCPKWWMFIAALLWTSISQLFGQAFPNYTFKYFDVKSGLKGAEVFNISQDKAGLLWIGTNNGLYRFDGYNFYPFENKQASDYNPLPGNYRFTLKHSDGHVWITTDYNGVSEFNPDNGLFNHYQVGPRDGKHIADGASYLIREDENKNLWFAHYFNGISIFNSKTKTFEYLTHQPGNSNSILSNEIFSLHCDKKGGIWIGYKNSGLSYYNFKSKTFKHYTSENGSGLFDNRLYSVLYDSENTLWIASYKGLAYKKPNSEIFVKLEHPEINSTYYLNGYLNPVNQLLYFASTNGICVVNPKNMTAKTYCFLPKEKEEIGMNRCTNLFFDNNNNLWAQYNQGFCLVTEAKTTVVKYNDLIGIGENKRLCYFELIKNNAIYSVVGNQLWIKSILNLHETKQITIPNFKTGNLKQGDVTLHMGSKYGNYIFISAGVNQMFLYNLVNNTFESIPNLPNNTAPSEHKIYESYTDKFGNIWGTDKTLGLIFYAHKENKWKTINPNNEKPNIDFFFYPTKFCEDKNGNVWCINPKFNIIRFSQVQTSNPSFTLFKHESNNLYSPSEQLLHALCETTDGNMVFAGNGKQLDYYSSALNKFYHIKREGCFDDIIKNLYSDNSGFLWCFNVQSIYKIKIKTSASNQINADEFEYHSYDWKNGFEGNYYGNNFIFETQDGRLFFDSKESLLSLNTAVFKTTTTKPLALIFSININGDIYRNKEANSDYLNWGVPKQLKLSSKQNNLEIVFASNSLLNAENNVYKYRMWPMEKEWRYTNALFPKAVYHNLAPGNYTFQLQTSNNEGIWSQQTTELNVEIIPSFIQSIWSKIILALIVLLLFFIFYRIRIQQLVKLQAERNKISRDLHDHLGSTISSAGFSTRLLNDNIDKVETRTKLISKIQNDIKLLGESIDEIIWSINPQNDNWEDLFSRIRRYGADLLDNSEIDYQFDFDPKITELKINAQIRKELFTIYKEALNNIIKHAEANYVNVSITIEFGKHIAMRIKDNGRGFDIAAPSNRNGLKNMRNRAEAIGASFNIRNENGTVIEVVL